MAFEGKESVKTLGAAGFPNALELEVAVPHRVVMWLGLVAAIAWLTVYLGTDVVARVASLSPVSIDGQPYFQTANAGLLYLWMPSVVVVSFLLLMLPGVFLVMALGKLRSWTDVWLRAFGASFIFWFLVLSIVKVVVETPLPQPVFLATVGAGGLVSWLVLAARVFCGKTLLSHVYDKTEVRRLLWVISIPLVGLVSLLPVVFWQDLNDDGIEALEIGRSLSTYLLPRFPNVTGFMGLGLGMIPMAYPVHWFVTLFGPLEAAARLPLFLYLPLLFCLLVQLIEWDSPRRLGFKEEALLCLALSIFTVTMSFNASYDPYFADIAAPTALEAMTIVCMLATIYFLWSGRTLWFLFFALISYLCRPSGLLFFGLLGVGIALCSREHRKSWLAQTLLAMGACVLLTVFYEKIYVPLIVGATGFGYPTESIFKRFQYLKLDDFSRISYALIPSGILPLMSLGAVRWQDPLGRVISIVSVSYLAVFYFQAFIALHHFVPVMILPLIVFWRMYLHHENGFRRVALPAAALSGMVAFWLSLPRHFEINRTVRAIGYKTAFLVGNYHTDFRTQVLRAKLLFKLIPPDWEVEDPTRELVSTPNSIIYYSAQPKPPGTSINYLVQPSDDPAPAGFTQIATDKVAALYIKDLQEWRRDRFRSLKTDYRSPAYDIPRTTLFRHWGVRHGQFSIDLKQLIVSAWAAPRN